MTPRGSVFREYSTKICPQLLREPGGIFPPGTVDPILVSQVIFLTNSCSKSTTPDEGCMGDPSNIPLPCSLYKPPSPSSGSSSPSHCRTSALLLWFLSPLPKGSRHIMGSLGASGIVVVFDFDKTIIDCDSDNWVIDGLGVTETFERLLPTMPWNTLMDRMMAELHSQGKSIDDIAECLRKAPLDPHIITGIKTAYDLGCDLRVVSDANDFFIRTILDHHGLLGYFSEINTNPSTVDEQGKLRISPFHDFTKSPHGCPLCPPNMCKGRIIERIQAEALTARVIYLGDGKGDYCPSLKLTEADFVMPRKGFPVWDLIVNDPRLVKAEVHEWSNGEEQEKVLIQLVNKALLSADEAAGKAKAAIGLDYQCPSVPLVHVRH